MNPTFLGLRALAREKLRTEKKLKREQKDRDILALYLSLGSTRKVAKKLHVSRGCIEGRINKFPEYQNHVHVRKRNGHSVICVRCKTAFTVYRIKGAKKFCTRACYLKSLVKTPEQSRLAKEREIESRRISQRKYLAKFRLRPDYKAITHERYLKYKPQIQARLAGKR